MNHFLKHHKIQTAVLLMVVIGCAAVAGLQVSANNSRSQAHKVAIAYTAAAHKYLTAKTAELQL